MRRADDIYIPPPATLDSASSDFSAMDRISIGWRPSTTMHAENATTSEVSRTPKSGSWLNSPTGPWTEPRTARRL